MPLNILLPNVFREKRNEKKNNKKNNNSDYRIVKMYKKNIKKKLISIGEVNLVKKRQSSITEFTSPFKR